MSDAHISVPAAPVDASRHVAPRNSSPSGGPRDPASGPDNAHDENHSGQPKDPAKELLAVDRALEPAAPAATLSATNVQSFYNPNLSFSMLRNRSPRRSLVPTSAVAADISAALAGAGTLSMGGAATIAKGTGAPLTTPALDWPLATINARGPPAPTDAPVGRRSESQQSLESITSAPASLRGVSESPSQSSLGTSRPAPPPASELLTHKFVVENLSLAFDHTFTYGIIAIDEQYFRYSRIKPRSNATDGAADGAGLAESLDALLVDPFALDVDQLEQNGWVEPALCEPIERVAFADYAKAVVGEGESTLDVAVGVLVRAQPLMVVRPRDVRSKKALLNLVGLILHARMSQTALPLSEMASPVVPAASRDGTPGPPDRPASAASADPLAVALGGSLPDGHALQGDATGQAASGRDIVALVANLAHDCSGLQRRASQLDSTLEGRMQRLADWAIRLASLDAQNAELLAALKHMAAVNDGLLSRLHLLESKHDGFSSELQDVASHIVKEEARLATNTEHILRLQVKLKAAAAVPRRSAVWRHVLVVGFCALGVLGLGVLLALLRPGGSAVSFKALL